MEFNWQKDAVDPNHQRQGNTSQQEISAPQDTSFGASGEEMQAAVAPQSVPETAPAAPFPIQGTPTQEMPAEVPSFAQPQPVAPVTETPLTETPAMEAPSPAPAVQSPEPTAPSFKELMEKRDASAQGMPTAPASDNPSQQQDAKETLRNLLDSDVFRGAASNRDRLEAIALRGMLEPGHEAQLHADGFDLARSVANSFKGQEADAFHAAVLALVQKGEMSTISPSTRQQLAMGELQGEIAGLRSTLEAASTLTAGQQIGEAAGTLAAASAIANTMEQAGQPTVTEAEHIAATAAAPTGQPLPDEQATIAAMEKQFPAQQQGASFAERVTARPPATVGQQGGIV